MYPLLASTFLALSCILSHSLPIVSAFQIPWLPHTRLRSRTLDHDGTLTKRAAVLHGLDDGLHPVGVKRMTLDEGEMFFPEYWNLERPQTLKSFALQRRNLTQDKEDWKTRSQQVQEDICNDEDQSELQTWSNLTYLSRAQAPLALHSSSEPRSLAHLLHHPRDILLLPSKRDFQCPSDTSACTMINRPNSCCPNSQACQLITGASGADVGCCAQEQSCSQEVSGCLPGYTTCPSNQGGGCCVPGYACTDTGCVVSSTATVTVNPTITATPSTSSSDLAPIIVSTSTQTDITIQTSTVTGSPLTSSSTTTSPTSPSATTSTSSSTRAIFVPPVRPTSGRATTSTTTTAPPTTITPSICPTGFYACSAYYNGGCCRTGRDCSSTSCPPISSSVILTSNGVNIAGPAVTTGQAGLGQNGCAQGWFRCGNTVGGGDGCCPSGYVCGASCTATAVNLGAGVSGTAVVAKDNGASQAAVHMGLASIALSTTFMYMFG